MGAQILSPAIRDHIVAPMAGLSNVSPSMYQT
jgi:hypothetical protein